MNTRKGKGDKFHNKILKTISTYCSCGTIPELSEAGVAGVIGVMGVSGVLYIGVFPGSAVVVVPATAWEWKS